VTRSGGDDRPRFTAGLGNDLPPERVAECARVLERETAFEALLVGDERLEHDPYASLALAAARTDRIALGTGVTNPYTRHPAVTAAAVATLDSVSDGRARLGLGVGSPIVLDPLGCDQRDPIGTLRDATRTVRSLLEGESVTIDRPEFACVDADLDVTPRGEVPIYVAGRGPSVLGLGGYRGDGVVAGAGLASPGGVAFAREHVAEGAEKAGRDPDDVDLVVWAFLSMADEDTAARAGVADLVARIVDRTPMGALEAIGIDPGAARAVEEIPDPADRPASDLVETLPRDLLERFAVTGTPAACRRQVAALLDAGADHVGVLAFGNEQLSRLETLRRFDAVVAGPLGAGD